MVTKTQARRKQDIKSKLMAAIAMLLVSSIMMVSSTYAWFTLSTAPEVTGISTAVGANGNLEMALLPKDGQTSNITSGAGDSTKDIEARNVTWGNLVDLSNNDIYGLNKITLYPAALNLNEAGKVAVEGFILKTPKYGPDGRVSELTPNAQTGYFDKQTKTFSPNNEKGVRAVGAASGMTERQLDYRNARSAANTASSLAANLASASLNDNGSSLANIAIEYGMNGTSATFNKTHVASLRAIVDDLMEENGVLDQLEKAYMQYILAYAASAATSTNDAATTDAIWNTVKEAVETDGATLASVVTVIGEDKIPSGVKTGIAEYNATVASVDTADEKLSALEATIATNADATFTWAEIKEAMEPLANPDKMLINGFKANEVKEKLGDLVSSVTEQGGLKVIMQTGAGVYADIADQSGDYTASITIEKVEYNGIVLNNMKARMETDSTLGTPYLTQVGGAVNTAGAPESASGTVLPISDMYGYIIDLAFRTNAAESKLLLQQDATDRIYTGNTNEQTMGKGSTMTFMATTTDFSNEQVKTLMNSIKIVFFNPDDGAIYCYGGLDTANASVGADGVTAEIYLYTLTKGDNTYTGATYEAGSGKTYYTMSKEYVYTKTTDTSDTSKDYYIKNEDGTDYITAGSTSDTSKDYYIRTEKEKYTAVSDDVASQAAQGTLYTMTPGSVSEAKIEDNSIMSLTQNTATALSVLVYLDGESVINEDVAATGSTSMTGKMNLQFASSANLVPMEYADLHIAGETPSTTNITNVSVTGDDNVTAAAVLNGNNIEITLTGYTDQTVTVQVGEGAAAPATVTNNKITVAAPEGFAPTTTAVKINVTAAQG